MLRTRPRASRGVYGVDLTRQGGFALLLLSYGVVFVLFAFHVSMVVRGQTALQSAQLFSDQASTFWAAEGGVDRALVDLAAAPPTNFTGPDSCTTDTTVPIRSDANTPTSIATTPISGSTASGTQAIYRFCLPTVNTVAGNEFSCMDLNTDGVCDNNSPSALFYRVETTGQGPRSASLDVAVDAEVPSPFFRIPFAIYAAKSFSITQDSQTGSVASPLAAPTLSQGDIAIGATAPLIHGTPVVSISGDSHVRGKVYLPPGANPAIVSVDATSSHEGIEFLDETPPALPEIQIPAVTPPSGPPASSTPSSAPEPPGGGSGLEDVIVIDLGTIDSDSQDPAQQPPVSCIQGALSGEPPVNVLATSIRLTELAGATLCTNGRVNLFVTGQHASGWSLLIDPGSTVVGHPHGSSLVDPDALTILVAGGGEIRLGRNASVSATAATFGSQAVVAARIYVNPANPASLGAVSLEQRLVLTGRVAADIVSLSAGTRVYDYLPGDSSPFRVRTPQTNFLAWYRNPPAAVAGTPPGQGGTPPGQGGTPPGQGEDPPPKDDDVPVDGSAEDGI